MKKYMSVSVTIAPTWNESSIYYSDDELHLDLHFYETAAKGWTRLQDLANRLGVRPTLTYNQYDTTIRYWVVRGFLD